MFKKHVIQLRVIKTPNTTPEIEEQKPFLTEDEIKFVKYVMKRSAIFALEYMAAKIILNAAAELVIKYV